jgi:hypothetical protein
MLQILPESRWDELRDVFRTEFDADLPHKGKSDILADIDENGKVTGFIVLQFVAHIGQIWNTGTKSRMMLEFFNKQIPPGNTVITIADTPRLKSIAERFGMRREEGEVFRKDF